MTEETKPARLDKNTLVPLGAMGAVFALIFGGFVWLDDQFDDVNKRLDKIEVRSETNLDDRWRGRDMVVWASKLRSNNPNLKVPEVN